MTHSRPNWIYDEFRQVGLDFADAAAVEAYDRRQGDKSEANARLLREASARPGDIVVDLGTGTGALAIAAALAGAKVHAVDISQAMLRHARVKALAAGASAITFHHAGFLTYVHAPGTADLVFSQFALHHLSDFWKQAALTRIAAMLRPGGLFVLRDVIFSFAPTEQGEAIEAWLAAVSREDGKGWSRADFEAHIRDEHSTYAWVIEGMLTRSGFAIERKDCSSSAYATIMARRQ
jgi:putative AdoMet-dependent methyltransferase